MLNAWSYQRFNEIIKIKKKDNIEKNSSNNSKFISSLGGSLSNSTAAGVSKHFLRKNYLKKNTYNEYNVKANNLNSSNKSNKYDSANDNQFNQSSK